MPENPGSDEIRERIRAIVAEQLDRPLDTVCNESRFTDLGADGSLEAIDIILSVERAFGVNIPDSIAERLSTVEDLARYVERRYLPEQLPIPCTPGAGDYGDLPRASSGEGGQVAEG